MDPFWVEANAKSFEFSAIISTDENVRIFKRKNVFLFFLKDLPLLKVLSTHRQPTANRKRDCAAQRNQNWYARLKAKQTAQRGGKERAGDEKREKKRRGERKEEGKFSTNQL